MKISKLFHWLYAFIMLMPVFFIAGRVAYVTFNKNAKDSYSGSTITYQKVYEQTNEVNSDDDLIYGNYYKFNCFSNSLSFLDQLEDDDTISFFDIRYISFAGMSTDETMFTFPSTYNPSTAIFINSNDYYFYFYYDKELDYIIDMAIYDDQYSYFIGKLEDLDLYFEDYYIFFEECPQEYLPYYFEEVEVSTLDNAFEYSVNQLNEVPLFSWAQTSFLVAPFSYITGLFGIASTSPVNTLLSYWLSISIIWLVFDLVMYLPLLIHRWLDKGVLE